MYANKEKDISHKDDYIIFSSNKDLNSLSGKNEYIVVSIDPATVSFGFRIEKRVVLRCNTKYCDVETIVLVKVQYNDTISDGSMTLYNNINDFLDQYVDYYRQADLIIIERQLSFNYLPLRVSQHCISYFCIFNRMTNSNSIIVELSGKVKTRLLNAPPKLDKREIKKWSVEKARELFVMRDDKIGLSTLVRIGKKLDDVSDATVQIEAFFTLLGLSITRNKNDSIDVFLF